MKLKKRKFLVVITKLGDDRSVYSLGVAGLLFVVEHESIGDNSGGSSKNCCVVYVGRENIVGVEVGIVLLTSELRVHVVDDEISLMNSTTTTLMAIDGQLKTRTFYSCSWTCYRRVVVDLLY